MDEDTKASLDGLALELQRSKVKASDLAGRHYDDRERRNHYQGKIESFAEAITMLNLRFGTRYETDYFQLRTYFAVPDKPCERR